MPLRLEQTGPEKAAYGPTGKAYSPATGAANLILCCI